MNIGITINLSTDIWSSGINQNAIYLSMLFDKIGYKTELLHSTDKNIENINNIKVIHIKEAYNKKYDILIQLGFTITKSIIDRFKKNNKNIKLVAYICGNHFVVDMESILFGSYSERTKLMEMDKEDPIALADQIWVIPQNEKIALQYQSFLSGQKNATVVPFIWNPISIENFNKEKGYSTYQNRDLKRVGVMEPNISVIKNVLLPLVALEKQYTLYKNLSEILLIGGDKLASNKRLMQILSNTDIYKDGLVSAETRIAIMDSINRYVDIVLSWQWENNLNYLWLDVAWMGWPVVHNGSLCKDVGYYYNEFDIKNAQEKIQEVIENHNDDKDYLERNRNIIKRYTMDNGNLLDQYKMLIDNVINDEFIKYEYLAIKNSIY